MLPDRLMLPDRFIASCKSWSHFWVRLTQRATGRRIRVFAAHFLQFKDNRITDYRAFLDTCEAVQQVLGRDIDVP